jgi:hypothetical protein
MIKKTPSILVLGIAALAVLGCSKQPAPAPTAPAGGADEEMSAEGVATPPVTPQEPVAERATKLLGYIQDKPECQQFKDAFEQAKSAGDETVDLEKIMGDAYKAGCAK